MSVRSDKSDLHRTCLIYACEAAAKKKVVLFAQSSFDMFPSQLCFALLSLCRAVLGLNRRRNKSKVERKTSFECFGFSRQTASGAICFHRIPFNGFNIVLDFHRYNSRGAFPAFQKERGPVSCTEAHQCDSRAGDVSDFRDFVSVHFDASWRWKVC